jgi:hypothetical protein
MGIVSSPTLKSKSTVVIAILQAIYLALFVTESGVFEAARTYARQLLLCTQSTHLGGQLRPQAVTRKARKSKATAASANNPEG